MLSKGFKAGKCKTSLKLAMARIKLLKNKREVHVKQLKRDLAGLLAAEQDQTAFIRVEHVIREEKTMSAYDLIELYCELIVARMTILESQKNCPIDLKEAVSSLIFASPRCADIPELLDVRKHFVAKYGKEFANSAVEVRPDCGVSRLIVEKLSAKAPDVGTKIKVLTTIAQEHDIKWEPKAFEERVQKPTEDLLNGPASFPHALPVEPSTAQFATSPAPWTNSASAAKQHENDTKVSSVGSNSFTPASIKYVSRPGQEVAESTYKHESGLTDFNIAAAPSSHQRWTMEFKDAASAAQAAAESAERASLAARAAAELASQRNDPGYSYKSHESSAYEPPYEAGSVPRSNFQAESRSSVKREDSISTTKQRTHTGLEAQGVEDHIRRDSWSINEDTESIRSQHSRVASSSSVSSPSRGDTNKANHHHKKSGKDAFPGEENSERYSIRSGPSCSSSNSLGDIPDLQKSDSTAESPFKAVSANQKSKDGANADAGPLGIGRKSGESLSPCSSVSSIDYDALRDSPIHEKFVTHQSIFGTEQETDHSSRKHDFRGVSSIDRDIIWDSPVRENRAGQNFQAGTGKEANDGNHNHDFSANRSAVFDRSDSEEDDHLDIDTSMRTDVFESAALRHPSLKWDNSPSHEQYHNLNEKGDSTSLLHSISRSEPEEISSMTKQVVAPSQSGVVYDVSDHTNSEDEDGVDVLPGRGVKALHDKNVEKNEQSQLPLRNSAGEKNIEKMDYNKQSDSDMESHQSSVDAQGLNFGKLTGGFRNKGFLRPTYVKSPVVDESPSLERSIDDSYRTNISLPASDVASLDADRKTMKYQERYSRKNKDSSPRYQSSSDSDIDVKNLNRHERGISHDIAPMLPASTPDHITMDSKRKALVRRLTKEESNNANDEKSQRPTQRTGEEATLRPYAAAYVEKGTRKQPAFPAEHHDDSVSSSLFKDQSEDTRAAASGTSRPSGLSDVSSVKSSFRKYKGSMSTASPSLDDEEDSGVYGTKSSVRKHKASVLTATPYRDEEKDDDGVVQQRVSGDSSPTSGRRHSQRTRGSRGNRRSNIESSSRDAVHDTAPALESKSLQSSDSMSETPSKTSTAGFKSGETRASKFLPPNLSAEQHEALFSETEILAHKNGDDLSTPAASESLLKSSNRRKRPEKGASKFLPPNSSSEQRSAVLPPAEATPKKDDLEPPERDSSRLVPSGGVSAEAASAATGGSPETATSGEVSASRENSLKGSHVHPKLPDYEIFAGYFKSLRSNARPKD